MEKEIGLQSYQPHRIRDHNENETFPTATNSIFKNVYIFIQILIICNNFGFIL
jgi:hypothetical protein